MSELLSAADQAELQRINTDNMPDLATVRRLPAVLAGTGVATAADGTRTLTPTTVAVDLPCRVGPAVPTEVWVGGQLLPGGTRQVAFAVGTDVGPRDELDVVLGTGEPLWLSVVGAPQPHAYNIGLFLVCKTRGVP